MTTRAVASEELRLRVIVVGPPVGVVIQMQRGRTDLEPAVRRSPAAMTFEFTVRVGKQPNGAPNFLGPFTQGPPTGRFVYINSGTLAGQAESCWSRRAKIPLAGITWSLIERAREAHAVLETKITGTGRDGGPVCATVPLRDGGWRLAR